MECSEWAAKGLTLTKHLWYTKLLLGSIDSTVSPLQPKKGNNRLTHPSMTTKTKKPKAKHPNHMAAVRPLPTAPRPPNNTTPHLNHKASNHIISSHNMALRSSNTLPVSRQAATVPPVVRTQVPMHSPPSRMGRGNRVVTLHNKTSQLDIHRRVRDRSIRVHCRHQMRIRQTPSIAHSRTSKGKLGKVS